MSITPESTRDLVKKPITAVSVIKNRTGGWLQQDGLRDLIGESFKAQRHNMYFHHYMVFALLNVCYCHQRPHYVTIRNPEPHEEGSFRGRKKNDGNKKRMIVWGKKSFRFLITSENRDMSNTVTLFVGPRALMLHQGFANVCCFKGVWGIQSQCKVCFRTDGAFLYSSFVL